MVWTDPVSGRQYRATDSSWIAVLRQTDRESIRASIEWLNYLHADPVEGADREQVDVDLEILRRCQRRMREGNHANLWSLWFEDERWYELSGNQVVAESLEVLAAYSAIRPAIFNRPPE